MTKRSRFERARRDAQQEDVARIEAAWRARLPADVTKEFARSVEAARTRGPIPPPPNQPPGTIPNPPRPGHEPKPKKAETRGSRRSG